MTTAQAKIDQQNQQLAKAALYIQELQATLAAREAVIGQQEATIRGYWHSIKIIGQQHDDRKAERDAAVQQLNELRGRLKDE